MDSAHILQYNLIIIINTIDAYRAALKRSAAVANGTTIILSPLFVAVDGYLTYSW